MGLSGKKTEIVLKIPRRCKVSTLGMLRSWYTYPDVHAHLVLLDCGEKLFCCLWDAGAAGA